MKPQPRRQSLSSTVQPSYSRSANAVDSGSDADALTIVDATVIESEPIGSASIPPASPPLPCPACGSPRQLGSRFCVSCGIPFETASKSAASPIADHRSASPQPTGRIDESLAKIATNAGGMTPVIVGGSPPSRQSPATHATTSSPKLPQQANTHVSTFRCESCGSELDIEQNQRSLRCPFCDSTYVIEINENERLRQRPEFVIGFAITQQRAQELFFTWLKKNSFFRPGDLIRKAVTEKQQGVYVPFWHFSMIADSRWSAQIGEYWYRTETYTVRDSDGKTKTMTRTVREVEWWPLSGVFRRYYSGYLVSASRGLPQTEALAIHPYQLNAMVRFRPMYIAGWMTEEYSIERDDAESIAKKEFINRQQRAISNFLPGDEQSQVSIDTQIEVGGSDLVLLPVHILSYRYGNRTFRFLVNGQTGQIYGDKPWSATRITLVIAIVAILLLLIAGIVIALNNPRFMQ